VDYLFFAHFAEIIFVDLWTFHSTYFSCWYFIRRGEPRWNRTPCVEEQRKLKSFEKQYCSPSRFVIFLLFS